MKYQEFSISLVSNPEKLKKFNEIYRLINTNEEFRNSIKTSIEKSLPLKEYEYAAYWHMKYLEGLEERVEQNKTNWQNKQKVGE